MLSLLIAAALAAAIVSIPAVSAAAPVGQVHYHQELKYSFVGKSSGGDFAGTVGLLRFSGAVTGHGFVVDSSGTNGFYFRTVSFTDKTSVCPGITINVLATVVSTFGNGLGTFPGLSIAVLLACRGPSAVTIVAPSCSAGIPRCAIAPRFFQTFHGDLEFIHA
jgi:hypothetical protein